MALTQSELEARIAALRRARDSGVLDVRHGEQRTIFRSLAEIDTILAGLEAELDAFNVEPKSRLRYIVQSDKGL